MTFDSLFATLIRMNLIIDWQIATHQKTQDALEKCAPFISEIWSKLGVELKAEQSVEMSLSFVKDHQIKKLNQDFREKDYATDVLSFPVHENLRSEGAGDLGVIHLGDIVISMNQAKLQAKENKITIEEEIVHLFSHGLLHLLGYDHEKSKAEEKIMQEKEFLLVDYLYSHLDWSSNE